MNTKDLIEALKTVKPGLDGNNDFMEDAKAFLFYEDKVISFNHELHVSYPLETGVGPCAVRAEELYKFLSKAKEQEIDMAIDGDFLRIKAGRKKVGLKINMNFGYEGVDVEKIKNWKRLPKNFVQNLKFCATAASNDATYPALTCVHIKEGRIEATDRYRMCLVDTKTPTDKELLLLKDHVKHVVACNPTKIAASKEWIHFKNEQGVILSCRMIEVEEYPNLDEITKPLEQQKQRIAFPKSFKESIDQSSIFLDSQHMYDQQILIEMSQKSVTIKSQSDYAWFESAMHIKFKGSPFNFKINPQLLLDILDDSLEIKMFLSERAFIFVGENWKYFTAINKL